MPRALTFGAARLAGLPRRELGDGRVVAEATTRRVRMLGLARLDDLPAAWGLWFPRCRSVHTFGMRFPLDLIWLGRDGEVVRVDRDLPRRRNATCRGARSVVEVRAGEADAFLAAGLADCWRLEGRESWRSRGSGYEGGEGGGSRGVRARSRRL